MDDRTNPSPKKIQIGRMCTRSFPKTSTFDVNYDCYHQRRDGSSQCSEIFQQESTLQYKDFKDPIKVVRNDEDLSNPYP
jgi:hypothetical protein